MLKQYQEAVFGSVEQTKSLVRVALHNRLNLLERYVAPDVTDPDLSFDEAFRVAKSGSVSCYELDGVVFMTGDTVRDGRVGNGTRRAGTSSEVVHAANHILNQVVELVRFVEANANVLAQLVASEGRLFAVRAQSGGRRCRARRRRS